jgi:hypothetical protein
MDSFVLFQILLKSRRFVPRLRQSVKPGSHEQRKRKHKKMKKFPFLAFAFVFALL